MKPADLFAIIVAAALFVFVGFAIGTLAEHSSYTHKAVTFTYGSRPDEFMYCYKHGGISTYSDSTEWRPLSPTDACSLMVYHK